ncbi:acyl-CoA thioesterase [Homoserinibacter sp. YIM 151385]|uniref:acyl-CoA thioesterase n=1 Tax=Homoserinibacter sp. YIM 151385 TaxID=2985506 RepID=UPI0022F12293|nr:thioesterase family protein [Homoserinibacter sp. YIM 151385]WBU37169.1 thioesterase family protein [Homoserinibacter sp. YIM 151385]
MDILLRAARYLRIRVSKAPSLEPTDVGRMSFRVQLSDLDELRHMNNGVYLSTMDLARVDLISRTGIWARMQEHGVYPVVAAQTISYRRSLELGQRYDIETRIVGYDARAAYLEQRFVVDGEIVARGYVAGRFLRRRGGVVSMEELGEITGVDVTAHPVPDWMREWAAAVALPSRKASAPSEW